MEGLNQVPLTGVGISVQSFLVVVNGVAHERRLVEGSIEFSEAGSLIDDSPKDSGAANTQAGPVLRLRLRRAGCLCSFPRCGSFWRERSCEGVSRCSPRRCGWGGGGW